MIYKEKMQFKGQQCFVWRIVSNVYARTEESDVCHRAVEYLKKLTKGSDIRVCSNVNISPAFMSKIFKNCLLYQFSRNNISYQRYVSFAEIKFFTAGSYHRTCYCFFNIELNLLKNDVNGQHSAVLCAVHMEWLFLSTAPYLSRFT